MLRVEFQDSINATVIRVTGPFIGRAATNAQGLMSQCRVPSKLIVDLSEVTVVDRIGEQVLSWLGQLGAKFVARTIYAAKTCQRLGLPSLRKRAARLPQGV